MLRRGNGIKLVDLHEGQLAQARLPHEDGLDTSILYGTALLGHPPGDGQGLYPARPVDLWWPWVGVIDG